MNVRWTCIFGFALLLAAGGARASDLPASVLAPGTSITQTYPALLKYTSDEPISNVRIGVGLSPFGMIRDQFSFSANIFQFHWVTSVLDWEVFSVSYASTLGGDQFTKSKNFTFRTVPKVKINQTFSVGPLLGYEFVSFPDLHSVIYNGTLATPQENFSSRGLTYGGVLSETFKLNQDLDLKLNQVAYRETYSTTSAYANGWVYRYTTAGLNQDQSPINPGWVFLLEFSILY